MNLLNYTLSRLLAAIPVLFGAIFVSFILVRIMHGSPFEQSPYYQDNPSAIAIKKQEMDLDKPMLSQFWFYIHNIFIAGSWGESISTLPGEPVWRIIWHKVPKTLEIQVATTLISSYIGIRLGVFSAVHEKSYRDNIIRLFTSLMYATPIFLLAIIFRTVFTQVLGWFPTRGYISPGYFQAYEQQRITGSGLVDAVLSGKFYLWWDILSHIFLPIAILVIGSMAGFTRYVRWNMLSVLELDYIRSARAKGCAESDVINRHALRNSMIPTISLIGMNFGFLYVGTTLIEYTFDIYGLGMLYLDAIANRDYFLIQALVLFIIGTVILANIFTDIIYSILDPRIRI